MKKILLIALLMVSTASFAQLTLEQMPDSLGWRTGLYMGAYGYVNDSTGDTVYNQVWIRTSPPNWQDTSITYHYNIYRITITTDGDTLYAYKSYEGQYNKYDTLIINGTPRSGFWIMQNHYDAAFRNEEIIIGRAVFRRDRHKIGL